MVDRTHRRARALQLLSLALFCAGTGLSATIVNGGFETGDLSGWTPLAYYTAGGPASGAPSYATFVASQSGSVPATPGIGVESVQNTNYDGTAAGGPDVNPFSGAFFAYLSNENILGESCGGGSCVTGSSLSQTFTLGSNPGQISLEAQFLTNDGVVGGMGANDFGGIALLSGSNVIDQFTLDGDSTSSANVHATIGANAGDFLSSTGWVPVTFDVSAYGNQTLTLVAFNQQGPDVGGPATFAESRLLLDAASSPASSTPEPSTFALIAFGLAAVGLLRRRRRPLES